MAIGVEQRREILPHIELAVLAADQHGDLAGPLWRSLRRRAPGRRAVSSSRRLNRRRRVSTFLALRASRRLDRLLDHQAFWRLFGFLGLGALLLAASAFRLGCRFRDGRSADFDLGGSALRRRLPAINGVGRIRRSCLGSALGLASAFRWLIRPWLRTAWHPTSSRRRCHRIAGIGGVGLVAQLGRVTDGRSQIEACRFDLARLALSALVASPASAPLSLLSRRSVVGRGRPGAARPSAWRAADARNSAGEISPGATITRAPILVQLHIFVAKPSACGCSHGTPDSPAARRHASRRPTR